ncbi:MAG: hypothetical protein ABIQ12_02800 [Opitutaceae bacterium]
MRFSPHHAGQLVVTFMLFGLAGWSASAAEEIEVTTVRFANIRASTGVPGTWVEADITLNVRPAPGTPGVMVSRVKVALLAGFELPALAGGDRRLEHYRAEAECVALESGRASVRFYLPPELVKRDQLHGDPKYWGIEIAVAGRPLPASRAAYSTTLSNAEQRKNFQAKAGAAAVANDGVMVPQYLTPFINEYVRTTPSFVRREVR